MKDVIYILLILFLLGLGCQKSAHQVKSNPAPAWSRHSSIYEVNLRQYSQDGSFQSFAEHLPRLKEMGVDILWFMPIQPIGIQNRKGTLGSYYSIRDYKAVNSEYGTLDDFKELVSQIHGMGMHVILDWVANHTAWDHVWTQDHPDWYNTDSLGHFIPPVPDWTDVIDLNYNNSAMRQAMIEAMKFWVDETNIDGFRCDVAEMVPLDFWKEAREQLDPVKSLFWLAEGAEPELHQYFHMTYNWELFHAMNAVAQGNASVNMLDSLTRVDQRIYPKEAYRMNFTTNHDENSWNGTVGERLGDGAEAFAVVAAMLPGMPLVYSGQEAGLDKRLNFFEKDPIDWSHLFRQNFYQKLLQLKIGTSCLQNGVGQGSYHRMRLKEKDVFAFVREDDGSQIFVVTNLGDADINLKINDSALDGQYQTLFSDKLVTVQQPFECELTPWSYEVYVRQ